MADIVAIADITDAHAVEAAEMLHQREIIRQCLAGMLQFAQRVDHRHARIGRERLDRGVLVGPGDDCIGPALKVLGVIADRLAGADAAFAVVQVDRPTAQPGHAHIEGGAGAQRVLLEQHHDGRGFIGIRTAVVAAAISSAESCASEIRSEAEIGLNA